MNVSELIKLSLEQNYDSLIKKLEGYDSVLKKNAVQLFQTI